MKTQNETTGRHEGGTKMTYENACKLLGYRTSNPIEYNARLARTRQACLVAEAPLRYRIACDTITRTAKTTDEARGEADRLAGYYDKWYRYNRADEGAAYDRGCAIAVESGSCPETFTLIEAGE